MREIKFRGKRLDNGQFVYGDLLTGRRGQCFIWGEHSDEVDPESVAQLIGHDSNGREVYEGDTLTDNIGTKWLATLDGFATYIVDGDEVVGDLNELTLVEVA